MGRLLLTHCAVSCVMCSPIVCVANSAWDMLLYFQLSERWSNGRVLQGQLSMMNVILLKELMNASKSVEFLKVDWAELWTVDV